MRNEEQLKKRKLRILTIIANNIDPEKSDDARKNLEIFETVAGIRQLAILEDETLQEVVDELGDNPMKEKKIFNLLEDNDPMGILKHIKSLKGNKGLDFDAMDALEVSRFIANVRFRVVSFNDADGNSKYTENTKDSKMPTFSESIELKKLFTDGKHSEATEYALKLSGLDVEKLSDWEKSLVESDINSYTVDILKTMNGGFY